MDKIIKKTPKEKSYEIKRSNKFEEEYNKKRKKDEEKNIENLLKLIHFYEPKS